MSVWFKPGWDSVPRFHRLIEHLLEQGYERDKGAAGLRLVRGQQLMAELGHDGEWGCSSKACPLGAGRHMR